jgi:hypothetical protein
MERKKSSERKWVSRERKRDVFRWEERERMRGIYNGWKSKIEFI